MYNSSIYYKHFKEREFIPRFQQHRGSLNVSKDTKKRKEKNVITQVAPETQDSNFAKQILFLNHDFLA